MTSNGEGGWERKGNSSASGVSQPPRLQFAAGPRLANGR